MSIYKELNDVKLDISEFQETPLSIMEQQRIIKGFKKKTNPYKKKKYWLVASAAVVAVAIISLSLGFDKGTIASMPFVGGVVEEYNYPNENIDFSSYKTAIGETAENTRGKLTLNEVMLDDQQVILSATFEPADGVRFDYQTFITPKVTINGEVISVTTGGQSIELNDAMFTIYNDIDLSKAIETENVNIEISYETWRHSSQDPEIIEQPWTFDVQVSQENLLVEKKVFELNQLITLNNGEKVTIEKVVSTPMSTTIYYDLSQTQSEGVYFSIQNEDGLEQTPTTTYTSNDLDEISYGRINGFVLEETEYYLIARDSAGNQLIESPVPIN